MEENERLPERLTDQCADAGSLPALARYDAGLLSDYGGGNVSWWQDYLRAELAYAHDFYEVQMIANWPLPAPPQA